MKRLLLAATLFAPCLIILALQWVYSPREIKPHKPLDLEALKRDLAEHAQPKPLDIAALKRDLEEQADIQARISLRLAAQRNPGPFDGLNLPPDLLAKLQEGLNPTRPTEDYLPKLFREPSRQPRLPEHSGLGPYINQDGRPVRLKPRIGPDHQYLQIQENYYGHGVHADQYGHIVREEPYFRR